MTLGRSFKEAREEPEPELELMAALGLETLETLTEHPIRSGPTRPVALEREMEQEKPMIMIAAKEEGLPKPAQAAMEAMLLRLRTASTIRVMFLATALKLVPRM